MEINLHDYDFVIINSSGGKDSVCAIWQLREMVFEQKYRFDKVVISHQNLGKMEWKDSKEIVKAQSRYFGFRIVFSVRLTKDGVQQNLLEHVRKKGMWPSNKQRYCTSDHKRGPGDRVVRALTPNPMVCKVLYVFGYRWEESPSRAKKTWLSPNKRLTTRNRTVMEYNPILDWDLKKVWRNINKNHLPVPFAYSLGMARYSCVFCIFAPFDALVIAGKANPELLQEYVNVETEIDHDFQHNKPIRKVLEAIQSGYEPKPNVDWKM